jgi:hypothetical protein
MNGARPGIDPAKIFILAMSVVVVGLAVAILFTFFSVKRYESAFVQAKVDFRRLAEAVEQNKEFRKAEEEGGAIDLENPIGYINEKARAANVYGYFDYSPDEKPQVRKGYVDTTFKLSFKQDVSRRELATFLYNLEKGSTILKAAALDLKKYRKTDDDEDLWRPIVTLAYRKTYIRPQ